MALSKHYHARIEIHFFGLDTPEAPDPNRMFISGVQYNEGRATLAVDFEVEDVNTIESVEEIILEEALALAMQQRQERRSRDIETLRKYGTPIEAVAMTVPLGDTTDLRFRVDHDG